MSLTSLIKRLEDIMRPDPGIDEPRSDSLKSFGFCSSKSLITKKKRPNLMTTTSLSSLKATAGETG